MSLFLLVNTLNDIRKKEILLSSVLVMFLVTIIDGGWGEDFYMSFVFFIPFMIIVFVLGKAGIGDLIVMTMMSLRLPYQENIRVQLFSMIIYMVALIIAVILKKDRKMRLPYIPFLLSGYVVNLVLSYGYNL